MKTHHVSRLFKVEKKRKGKKEIIQYLPKEKSLSEKRNIAGKFAIMINRLDLSVKDIYRIYCTQHTVERSFH